MKFHISLILIIFCIKTMAQDSISILHFNIQELDTSKLTSQSKQLINVKKITDKYSPDLVSINELQYDFPNIPNSNYKTEGENLNKLKSLLGLKALKHTSFNPANTGLNAQKNSNGQYNLKPDTAEARKLADQVNFGTIPGQYSSGLMSKFPIKSEKIFNKIKWKDFNPSIDFSEFALANGKKYPETAELFDKNFSDITVQVGDKELHIILLHTVPSYHFGNMKSPNFKRNADQLRFLEWYLTGTTDIEVNLPGIKPLAKNTYYVAVGDWNTAYDSMTNPGSLVLRRLYSKAQLWLSSTKEMSFTNEGAGFKENPFRLMLDYIAYSKNIEAISGEIIHPKFDRVQLGCKKVQTNEIPKDKILVSWKEKNKECFALVDPWDKVFKEASDHYPLQGKFKLK